MVPPNTQPLPTDDQRRANERAEQLRRERSIAARVWLEKAMRALEVERPIHDP